jgi:tetratricopeptide (TPR) repeat protein
LLGRQEALGILGEADSWKADILSLVELSKTFENENYLVEAYLRQAIYGARATDEILIDQALRDGLAIARGCQNETIEAKLLAMQAVRFLATGNIQEAIETIEEALQRARRLEDDNVLAFVLYQAAFGYSDMGEVSKASPLQLEQVELDHRLGNRHQELIGLGNQASTYLAMGLYKQARSNLEQAIRICRDLGARRPLAYDLMNLADVFLALGETRKAHHLAVEALDVISPSQDARGIAFALNDLGRVLLAMGDAQGAARRFKDALDLTVRRGQTGLPLECESKIYLAASKVLQGELDEAECLILPAWDYLRDHGFPGMGNPSAVYRTCVETFDALGDTEHYLAALETSCKVILDVADKLTIPEWRQAFLEAVPDNRALLEMWERGKG